MTDADLARLKEVAARLEATGTLPWCFYRNPQGKPSRAIFIPDEPEPGLQAIVCQKVRSEADLFFILHARDDIPFLLTLVNNLRALLDDVLHERGEDERTGKAVEAERRRCAQAVMTEDLPRGTISHFAREALYELILGWRDRK